MHLASYGATYHPRVPGPATAHPRRAARLDGDGVAAGAVRGVRVVGGCFLKEGGAGSGIRQEGDVGCVATRAGGAEPTVLIGFVVEVAVDVACDDLYVVVAIMWLVPDRRIETTLTQTAQSE